MREPAKILADYREGNHLSDAELQFLMDSMRGIASALSNYGDLFALQARYAVMVANSCDSFLRSRIERRQRLARREKATSCAED
jgi:hypothetical protein